MEDFVGLKGGSGRGWYILFTFSLSDTILINLVGWGQQM